MKTISFNASNFEGQCTVDEEFAPLLQQMNDIAVKHNLIVAITSSLRMDTNVAGATVSWFGPESGSTETDSGGEFAIAGLTAGTYDLIATYPGCNPASAEVVVTAGLTVQKDLMPHC